MQSMMYVRRMAVGGLLMFLGIVAACDDNTGPGDDFLIRLPADNVASAVVESIHVSSVSPDSVEFEWEAAPGADAYSVVFWRADSRDDMRLLEADYASPGLVFELPAPEIVQVPFDPDDPDDDRELAVVQLRVAHSDIASRLVEEGVVPGRESYWVWTVYARKGAREWRSSETQRLVLTLSSP